MGIVVPDASEIELLDKLLKDPLTTDENYIVRLYNNNYTPDANTVTASFVQSSFTGYVAKTLTRASFSCTTVSGIAVGTTSSNPLQWTCGSAEACYGYYVTGSVSGTVLWCEKFAAVRNLVNTDILSLSINFSLHSEN